MSHPPNPSPESLCRHPWVIIGCGYTGTRLARRLVAAGAQLWLTRRDPTVAHRLAQDLGATAGKALDLDDPDSLATLTEWLPNDAYIIDSAPPGARSPDAEHALVQAIASVGARRLVYISSTSVYPPSDGQWIDEDSPVAPQSDRGKARLAAESATLAAAAAAGVSTVSLRVVGIYGPGRGVHARLHGNRYRIIGAGDTYVNRVHVDDLVSAVIAAATAPELPRRIYHVADDLPARSREYADQVADIMGVAYAPSVPETAVAPWIVSMLRANRRVSNARLKRELGVSLRYPTWREGLRQVLQEDGIATPK